jgi:hypothetical protein
LITDTTGNLSARGTIFGVPVTYLFSYPARWGNCIYILTPGIEAAGLNVDKTRTNSGHYFVKNGCQMAQGEL